MRDTEELDFCRPDSHPGHSTGPRTPHGKCRSSRNAVTHGCRSQILILPGERQEDFDDLYDRWMAAHQPEDEAAAELVEQLILNKWFLERNLRRFMEIERKLAQTAYSEWTDAQHKEFQLALRYKTAAGRAVTRATHELEVYLKSLRQEEKDIWRAKGGLYDLSFRLSAEMRKQEAAIQKQIAEARQAGVDISEERESLAKSQKLTREALDNVQTQLSAFDRPKTGAEAVFQGQNHPTKLRKIPILDQWIEITVTDGQTRTRLFPPNDRLIEQGQAMLPPPQLVYRRLNFLNGVPEEYSWAISDPQTLANGGMGIQRMTVDTWLEVVEREKTNPSGHIGPCGGNLPRPKQRGGCDCEVCTHNQAILDAQLHDM